MDCNRSSMCLILFLLFPHVSSHTFLVGYITGSARRPGDLEYARPGLTISGAISLAVAEVNAASPDLQLRFHVAETYGDEQESIRRAAELWRGNVSAYIGPQETCVHEGRMAQAFNLPMISYFCTHYETSNKRDFPTFARTRPPDTQISKSVAAVLLHFNWKHVVFFFPNSTDIEYEKVASTILHTFQSAGITVRSTKWWDSQYHHGYMDNPFHRLVEETYRETRIYVILGHHYEHVGLMVAMEERKLFDQGEYWVIGVDIEQYDEENPTKYLRGLLRDESDPLAQRAFRSYLGIVASSPVGFENFTLAVNKYMEKPPFNFPNPVGYLGGVKRIRAEAAYLYDAVHLYARALIKVLDSGGNPLNGTAIINSIKRCHYRSAMGYMVYMDENGDAEGNYTLLARRKHPHLFNEYGLYPVGMFLPGAELNGTNLPILHLTADLNWLNQNNKPPIAVPPCGFRGEKCITHTIEITAGVAGGAFLALTIAGLVLYRNWKYEQELDSLLWKVDFRDIQVIDESACTLGGKGYTRVSHPLVRSSQVSLSSNPDSDFRYSSIFTQVGVYKGRLFAIKKVHKKSIDITREMKKELKMMRDLRHDNLNGFIGACTDPPNICIVREYCARGSLKDILENEDVKLDNMFIASLVEDILRGMIFLHESQIRFHGALHTGNCLVDSRWVVKITDFGLHEFKRGAEDPAFRDSEKILDECQVLLYRAPELLRAAQTYNAYDQPCGSQKGDVYSFGIVLYELHGRKGPFGEMGLSIADILHRIVKVPLPGSQPFRPQVESLENSFDFVRDCLRECWLENPDERPEFKSVRTKLRPLRKGMKPNIFDNMMAMMEKYANNLEVLVDERTDQLQEEKKKTEALLYEMLPRSVAEQLKKGHKVEAENFDCVTIYFSDIVGFTEMSAISTPLQVVDFLNDLYTCFDSIIENYDVYKVETIGDAYMVVSGLPIRNGDQHAAEIATMSLHLLTEVKHFTIRHMRTEKLKLRIGIHSGPVCAGVVGLKMPRYCLFGDTVNTASRMESSGLPLKIHCSKESKVLLSNLGGYHLLDRGIISMKGKGDQITYWLIGENIDKHTERSLNRQRKRAGLSNLTLDNNNDKLNGFPRSSLKNKNSIIRSPLPRCSSLESPKRLRFASGEHIHHHRNDSLLEVINDSSPCKKSCGSLVENSLDCCSEALRTSSTSCPCIENLANSSATLAHSQLSVFARDDKPSYLSVPSLCSRPKLSVLFPVQTLSAPVSPNKRHVAHKLPSSLCEYVYNEESPWNDETPLLNGVLNKESLLVGYKL